MIFSQPLFLYLAFQAVHSANADQPLQAPAEYVERFPNIKSAKRRMFAGNSPGSGLPNLVKLFLPPLKLA